MSNTETTPRGRTITLLLTSLLLAGTLLTAIPGTLADANSSSSSATTPIFEIGERSSPGVGAKSICTLPQNDAASGADAGDGHLASLGLGSDPTQQNISGCIDAADTADFYDVQISADKDVEVELTVPSGADFDLYIKDSTNVTFVDVSEFDDPLESVFFTTNISSSGTYYIWVNLWTGDGDYTLDIWTNISSPKPDLTVSDIDGPISATLGDTVTINYTVNNIGAAALTSATPYDIPIVLSTDATYDTADTILTEQILGPNLAATQNQSMSSQVQIPASLPGGTYYWIVWPDGWGNVTEEDELNNVGSSIATMSVSSGSNSTQNDAGTGSDLSDTSANAINFIFSGSTTFTGDIGGNDTDDWLRISYNSNENLSAGLSFAVGNDFDLTLYDNTSTLLLDQSTTNNPESVTVNGTGFNGTLVYLHIEAISGSGSWTLDIWKFPRITGNGSSNVTNLTADALEPNDAGSNATSAVIPFSQTSLTIHSATDEDIFAFPVTAGGTYWVNITFIGADGDLDLELFDDAQLTNRLDFSWSTSDDESVSDIAAINTTFYARVYGYLGAINTYAITIETDTTPALPANGDLDVIFLDSAGGEYNATNLDAGIDYSIHAILTAWNGSAHNIIGELWDNWTQAAGDRVFPVTTSLSEGGWYCLFGDLYDMSYSSVGAMLGSTSDCIDFILVEPVITSDTSADVFLTNLTSGSYSIDWYLYNDFGPTYSQSGSQVVNVPAGGSATETIAWSAPSSGLKCFYTVLYDFNQTYVDDGFECFTPTFPDVVITGMDNTSVNFDLFNLTIGTDYANQVSIWEVLNGTLYAQSALTSFTAFSSTSQGWSWTFAAPTTDGNYCAYVDLFDVNSSLLATDILCIWIEFDDDDDGVMNLADLCPNTPAGSAVNADGCALSEIDSDGDGYTDDIDAFVNDPWEWADSDGDGYGDNFADAFPTDPSQWSDADGDGYGDNASGTMGDAFPNDATQWSDSDGDGCGDNPNGTNPDQFPNDPSECSDSDGDGVGDNADAFPNDSSQWSDIDGDGCGDNPAGNNPDLFPNDAAECTDVDGDGVGDNGDAFPNDSSQWSDMDGDGWGDNASGNNPDAFPSDPNEWVDTDGDGCGDNGDEYPTDPSECADSDGDGYGDNEDAFPNDMTEWMDSDGDGVGDNGDAFPFDSSQTTDSDGDGYGDNPLGNNSDAFPNDDTQWLDRDGDGYGDNQQGNSPDAFPDEATQWNDRDGDGFGDNMAGVNPDHCPDTPAGQAVNAEGCALSELDSDNDTISDDADACPDTPLNEQSDEFGCSPSQKDTDFDTINDDRDACPDTPLGAEIDMAGCAQSQLDDDSDDVMNDVDMCDGTPMNEEADEFGCAPSQLDSDDDGVYDDKDTCPDSTIPSPAGIEIDDWGCDSDFASPQITLNGEADVSIEFDAIYSDQGAMCDDNVDGELDSQITTQSNVESGVVGDYQVTYECTDSSGNAAQATRIVHVVDSSPPVIMLYGQDNISLEVGTPYLDEGATCYDGLDGDISNSVSVSGLEDVDAETAGVYSILYECQDAAGNYAEEETRIVEFSETDRQVNSGGGFAAGAGLSTSTMTAIVAIVAVLVLIGGAGMMFLRGSKDVEEIKSMAQGALIQAQHEAGQWQDESGLHWSRQDDGSLLWWDANANEWQRYE